VAVRLSDDEVAKVDRARRLVGLSRGEYLRWVATKAREEVVRGPQNPPTRGISEVP
jgi:hypothetical protein